MGSTNDNLDNISKIIHYFSALIESEQNDSLFICNFFLSLLLFTVIYLRWFVNSGGPIEFQPFPEYVLLANIITCKIENDLKDLTAVNFLKVFWSFDYWTSCKKKLFRWNPKMALLTKGPERKIEEGFSVSIFFVNFLGVTFKIYFLGKQRFIWENKSWDPLIHMNKSIHAKSGWYLWYITANFFGFSAKF